MLPEVIFVHFSFLSASFANILTQFSHNQHHPSTRGYSSEWQFRGNFMDAGSTFDPNLKSITTTTTTEKLIQYANGWRPIPSSRSLLRDREARSGNPYAGSPVVRIAGPRNKPPPYKSWKRSPNPFPPTIGNQPYAFPFVSSLIPNATNILPQIRHNSYPVDRVTSATENSRPPYRQYDLDRTKKSKKVVKEDDLVWMHYNSVDQVPKPLPYVSNDLAEVRQLDQYDTDMMMEETQDDSGPFVVYSSSTGIAEPVHTSTDDSPSITTLTTPRTHLSLSRNSYEIIDKNNRDNFKPMTTTQKIDEDEATMIGNDDDDGEEEEEQKETSWPDFHNILHGTNETTNKPVTEQNPSPPRCTSASTATTTTHTPQETAYVNSESKRSRGLFNTTTAENISRVYPWSKKSTNNENGRKTNKYFLKPIVITETPPEDEYFQQLLYDSLEDDVRNNRQTVDEPKENSTQAIVDRNDDELLAGEPTGMQSHHKALNSTGGDRYKVEEVVVQKKVRASDDTWNFLLNMTEAGAQLADLIPVTLKTNIFLVKKLIVECYSDLDEANSRGNTINCLKKITFKVLDRAVESDVVKITDSVSLVRDGNATSVDRFSSSISDDAADWLSSFVERLQRLFSTHSLKVKLANSAETENVQVEGRRRHRFRRVFPVVAGIYMTITAVVIPIVFQFMAMMGGKSFIISKLALLFALFSSFSKFFTQSADNNQHHHSTLPLPPPLPPLPYPHYHYNHPAKRKSDKRFKRIPVDYNYSYYLVE